MKFGKIHRDKVVSFGPSDKKILAFWSWFSRNGNALRSNFHNAELLGKLDEKVSELGNVAWELGPGKDEENALAISPDGNVQLLKTTERIVEMAPSIAGWEFLPARPPRSPSSCFSINSSQGTELAIDASKWRYVIYQFPDNTVDLVLEQSNLLCVTEDDRYRVAVILVDGLLGEAKRLRCIRNIEPVLAFSAEQAARASSVFDLSSHLDALLSDRKNSGST